MNTMWRSCIPLACLVTLTLLFSVNAQAEPYVAAQAGVTFHGDLTNVEGIQTLQGVKTTDLALKTSMEENSDTSPGLNVLAGLRYLVTRHLGVYRVQV